MAKKRLEVRGGVRGSPFWMLMLIFLIGLTVSRPELLSVFFNWFEYHLTTIPEKRGDISQPLVPPPIQPKPRTDATPKSPIGDEQQTSTVIVSIYIVNEDRVYYPPQDTKLRLEVYNPQTDQFEKAGGAVGSFRGQYEFQRIPCGYPFRVFVENLNTAGYASGFWKEERPPMYPTLKPLPCGSIVDVGAFRLYLNIAESYASEETTQSK